MVPLSSTSHMQSSYDGDTKGVTCFAPTTKQSLCGKDNIENWMNTARQTSLISCQTIMDQPTLLPQWRKFMEKITNINKIRV